MSTKSAGPLEAARRVLLRYALPSSPRDCTPIATPGFSGAQLWRVDTGEAVFCLRRWPREHPLRERLEFIHAVLNHVAANGFSLIPVPLPDRTGQTIVGDDHTWWELTPWLPGAADFLRRGSPAKVAAAMTALAQFHQAAHTFPPLQAGTSPSVVERTQKLHELEHGGLARLATAIRGGDWPSLTNPAQQFIDLAVTVLDRVKRRLTSARSLQVPLQPCIRDIWHEHVLFNDERVVGFVDFGAMRVDNIACDVARLSGSLVADDVTLRSAALGEYERVRPLSGAERLLVTAFDQSTVVLGGLNWLSWIFVEGRQFPDRQRVQERFAALLTRLRHMAK